MSTLKLKVLACAMLVVVAAPGPSVARGMARPVIRLPDRVISVAGSTFSATKVPGVVKVQLAVKMDNLGHGSLGVSASDFVVSAEGDTFSPQPRHGPHRRLRIAPGHSRAFPLTFALPRAAVNDASLSYRSGQSGAIGAIPIEGLSRAIHRASSASATPQAMNTFYATGGVGDPWGTAIDRAGNVWFAEPGCDFAPTCPASAGPGQIGELEASSHTMAFYTLPSIGGNQPSFLAFDESGNLWFTTPNNSMIGEFNPSTGQFVGQWPVTPGSGPWDLTFASGKIWYTEHLVSAVGVFDPSTHAHQDFQTPSADSNPYGIAADAGLIWFTENNSSVDRIAVLNASNDTISEYPITQPVSNSTPHLVAIGASGHPWWTEGFSNTIATLDPAAATPGQCGTTSGTCKGIQRFEAPAPTSCSTSGTHTSGIAIQPSTGLVWFDNSLTAQVGSFNPSSGTFAMTSLSSCGAHPHDGLGLDGTGSVWFAEEFANAIGELIPPPPGPAQPPGAPTGVSATAGDGNATVSFIQPSSGGAPITSYTVTASPGGAHASGGSAPIIVTGLADGTSYTFTVTATNSVGTGPASAPSNAVTPAPATGGGTTGGGTTGASPTVQSAASPVEQGAPVNTSPLPTRVKIASLLRKEIAPPSGAGTMRAILRTGAYQIRIPVLGAGHLSERWISRGRPGHKSILVATGFASFQAAGTKTITMRLTKAGRRLLAKSHRVELFATGWFTAPGHIGVFESTTFTLSR